MELVDTLDSKSSSFAGVTVRPRPSVPKNIMQETTSLLSGAIDLSIYGMGFVFLFLALMVFTTGLMSRIVNGSKKSILDQQDIADFKNSEIALDEETKFVIKQAIKMHRGG